MPTRDRVLALFQEKTFSRIYSVAMFVCLLALFRHMWAIVLFFVLFQRTFGFFTRQLTTRSKLREKPALAITLAVFLLAVGLAVAFGATGLVGRIKLMKAEFPDWITTVKAQPLYARFHEQVDESDRLVEGAKQYGAEALTFASKVGRFFVEALIGFVLAVVYMLERHELEEFAHKIHVKSLFGRLLRWMSHVADAVSVTIQLQLVVAIFNTVTTLPVLLLLHIGHIPALMALIFVSALVPVIGNLVSGGVLCLLAYQARGPFGVGCFLVLTFLLHKVESYYLSPRLTARHVKVPGFVLIASLIAFEHVFGFAGVFLSFPFLFVAGRIRSEFANEDSSENAVIAVPTA